MNYLELKEHIAEYLDSSDLTQQIPTMISQAEQKIALQVKVDGFETNTTGNTVSGTESIAQPARFRAPISFTIAGKPIARRTYGFLRQYTGGLASNSGTPIMYATLGTSFILAPNPDAVLAYEVVYYERLAALASATDTNWITDNAVDLLIYGTLLEFEPFLKNDERVAGWRAMYEDMANSVRADDAAYRVDEVVS